MMPYAKLTKAQRTSRESYLEAMRERWRENPPVLKTGRRPRPHMLAKAVRSAAELVRAQEDANPVQLEYLAFAAELLDEVEP